MVRWFLSERPGYLRVAPQSDDGFTPTAAFTTRLGGVSLPPYDALNLSTGVGDDPRDVETNRAALLAALGLPPGSIAYATQVHGAAVIAPRAPGACGEADALVTTDPAITLAAGTADCLGVLLWSRDVPAVAAVHAGWRGAVAGVVAAAVEALARVPGVAAARVGAALGPRIGPCCFEVGRDVAALFPDDEVVARGPGVAVDLARAARRQLRAAGVPDDAVLDVERCTACEAATWFSHRRDRGRTGRSWAVIAARGAAPCGPHESAV
jgi:YfiH family protein